MTARPPVRRGKTTIAVHHFKWDNTLSERLEMRLTDAWKARCHWWTQTARLRRALDFNGGRIPLHALTRFDFKDDAFPLDIEPYRSNERSREWEGTGRHRVWGGLPG